MIATRKYDIVELKETESLLDTRFQQYIEPFWREQVVNGYFSGKDNIQIAYAFVLHPNARGSIAISSGRIETLLKYKELIFNLYNAGYSVFIHDHRGQGLSGRMTANTQQGYVASFDDYVSDFKIFFDRVIAPKSATKPILISHSMGAAIASLYLIKHPDDFEKCVMSAPMFGIRPALPNVIAYALLSFHMLCNRVLSKEPWYFLGQGDYMPADFNKNVLTRSETRYKVFRAEYEENPSIKLGGVTNKWLFEAYRAMSLIYQNADSIVSPVLLLQAGDDKVVDNCRQDKMVAKLPNCKHVYLENARHELFMELEETRDECLREILTFIETNP
ncbi:MAG: alpha/beta fold hydrolase [Aliiglaciecola sp.]